MKQLTVYNRKKQKRYTLYRNLNIENNRKILSEIKSCDTLKDPYYGPRIYNFIEYLINQNVNITNLCNNLRTLKIVTQEEDDCYYDSSDNVLGCNSDLENLDLYFALFQVASTHYNEDKTLNGIGFEFKGNGIGINNFCTFKFTKDYLSINENYCYADYITEKLEKIVGKKKLKRLYCDGNLFGLINILHKYEKQEAIWRFMQNADYIYLIYAGDIDCNNVSKNIVEEKLLEINQFFANCFSKKYSNDSGCFYKNKLELLKSLFDMPSLLVIGDVKFIINNYKIRKNIIDNITIEEKNNKTNNEPKSKRKLKK